MLKRLQHILLSDTEDTRFVILLIEILLVFLVTFSISIYWQFTKTVGDPDGFYHAKMALMLSDGVLLKSMPWMQFSTLRDVFTDHHFLYHLILVPFVRLGNPLLGVKLAQAFFNAGFFATFYWFLKQYRMNIPILFTGILVCTSSFTFRLGLIKANSLSLIVLFLILYALLEKRWILLFIVNSIYVWLYGGWLIAPVVAIIYSTILFFHIHFARTSINFLDRIFKGPRSVVRWWTGAVVAASGSAIGLCINPYWPHNLLFYKEQIWQIAIINTSSISVGGEWSALGLSEFFTFYSVILIFFFIAVTLCIKEFRKISARSWLFFFLSVLTIGFTIKSRRYIELSAPFAVLFSASAISEIFPRQLLRDISVHASKRIREAYSLFIMSGSIAILVCLFIPSFGIYQIQKVRDELSSGIPFNRYERVSRWLSESTPHGSIVVQSDWDDWPILFYHNTHNYYIIGLDPTFMYNYDRQLYKEWADLTSSGKSQDPVQLISERLRAKYVFVEKDHQAMNQVFAHNVYFSLVYEDDEALVYSVIENSS